MSIRIVQVESGTAHDSPDCSPTVCCPEEGAPAYQGNKTSLFAGRNEDGSDGTRTRDLRRDRPEFASEAPTGLRRGRDGSVLFTEDAVITRTLTSSGLDRQRLRS
jgi:hypothetical protein